MAQSPGALSGAPSFREPSDRNMLGTEGKVQCITCGHHQPFLNRICDKCGKDPWASKTDLPAAVSPSPSAPSADENIPSLSSLVLSDPAAAAEDEEVDLPPVPETLPGRVNGGAVIPPPVPVIRRASSDGARARELDYAAVAADHAECSICFEPLCAHQTSVLTWDEKRVCQHFFHVRCSENMLEVDHGECPLCRAEFDDMLPVPRIEDDSDAWFDVCDADGDGSLSAREVYEILIAQFPVDHKKLEENLPRLFRTWDPNMDGQIEKHEFLRPEGLLEYVKQNFIRMEEKAPPPNICRDKRAWFEYFDDDKSGELSQEEVGRALIKSFGLENKLSEIASMKETVACCWAIFDPDGSGEIDMDEFLNNDGIADAIIAATQHTPPPTEEVLAAAIAAAENSRPHPNLPEESW